MKRGEWHQPVWQQFQACSCLPLLQTCRAVCFPGCRQLGSLKVCSHSLCFVPRDVQQPIFRVPYEATSAIEA